MQTSAMYLDDTYLFNSEGIIIGGGIDDKGRYLLLTQTIFYPQGGGQPSDQGLLTIQSSQKNILIYFVRQVTGEIRHYYNEETEINWNNQLRCDLSIEPERRLLNARYHTAAHLLSNIIECCYAQVQAVKGHSFPSEAYVEFKNNTKEMIDLELIERKLDQAISSDLRTKVFEDKELIGSKGLRRIQIGKYIEIPCGGTHVGSTREIVSIELREIRSRGEVTKVSYVLVQ